MKRPSKGSLEQENKEVLDAEILVSMSLLVGVVTCAIIASVGILISLLGWGNTESLDSTQVVSTLLDGKVLSEFKPVSSPYELMMGALHWQPDIIMTAALLLLIALPILRVALTTAIFTRERDWPFVAITLIVLSVLLSGIFMGRAL